MLEIKKMDAKKTFMHVLISGEIGRDHADGNKLNNTRENLRICSSSQNNMNKKLTIKNKSGFKGVHFHKPSKKWVTTIYKNGDVKFQRSFSDIQEAAHAYNKAAVEFHGEFAVLNPIGFDYTE